MNNSLCLRISLLMLAANLAFDSASAADAAKVDDAAPARALFKGMSKQDQENVAARIREAAAKRTPRTTQGKPDLSGFWRPSTAGANFGAAPAVSGDGKRLEITLPPVNAVNKLDNENVARRLAMVDARPQYASPEHQAKAQHNFDNADFEDPAFRCAPPGVPRIGVPAEIVQTAAVVYLLYEAQNRYRVIPVDGRKHDPDKESMPNGDSIGYWQGDTLLVDTVNIAEDTWFDRDGSFHSPNLRVIERFTRKGDSLEYQVVSEDPWFVKPFSPRPVTLLVGKPDQHVVEDYACIEQSLNHMVSKERH